MAVQGTYGRGQMLGAGIDPRLFVQDYSGFANAGATQGQMLAGIGQSIAKGIEGYQEKKKEQAGIERQIKKADNVAKAIADLVPELAPTIEASRMQMMDMNLPQNERLAVAEGIDQILNIGLAEVRGRQERAFRSQELAARYAPEPPEPIKAVGNPFKVRMQSGDQEVDVDYVRLNDGRMVPLYEYQQMQKGQTADSISELPTNDYLAGIDSGAIDIGIDGERMPEGVPLDDGMVLPPRQNAPLVGQPGVTVVKPNQGWEQNVDVGGGLMGQRNTKTGEVKVYPGQGKAGISVNVAGSAPAPPQGYKNVFDEAGNLIRQEAIPGGPAAQEAEAEKAKEEKVKAASESKAISLTQDLFEIKRRYSDLEPQNGVIPAMSRIAAGRIPGTQTRALKSIIDRVRSSLTLEELQSIRQNSPTGGALGNVSDKDVETLRNAVTNLEESQSPEAFNREWLRLTEKLLNIAYGAKEQRDKLVKEGKLTQDENEEIDFLYPSETINVKGEIVRRRAVSQSKTPTLISPEVQKILDSVAPKQ